MEHQQESSLFLHSRIHFSNHTFFLYHIFLSAKQKEIVEQLLDARDRQDIEYSNLSYLAGIIDCIKFLKYFNIPIDGVLEDE